MTPVLWEVGGSIRDSFMGIDSKDKDFAVEAESFDAMREFLVSEGYTIFVETPHFLTIRAHFPKGHEQFGKTTADFVLCRKDGAYSDGRRPDEVTPGTILDDLARRDFTINAMARKVGDDQILDPHDGYTDLHNGTLRCVGSAAARITEDPLRVMRALRFVICKGLTPDAELHQEMTNRLIGISLESVSIERIRDELFRCFRFDTLRTMRLLSTEFEDIGKAVLEGPLWLKPTLEE